MSRPKQGSARRRIESRLHAILRRVRPRRVPEPLRSAVLRISEGKRPGATVICGCLRYYGAARGSCYYGADLSLSAPVFVELGERRSA